MNPVPAQSSDVWLARVNRELERISEVQHRLTRRNALLQEQATRLRLGSSPFALGLTLEVEIAAECDDTGGWPWTSATPVAAKEGARLGGVLL